jgi:hypothetical protein
VGHDAATVKRFFSLSAPRLGSGHVGGRAGPHGMWRGGVILYYTHTQMLHGSRIGGMNEDSALGIPTWKDIYVRR